MSRQKQLDSKIIDLKIILIKDNSLNQSMLPPLAPIE